MDISTLVSTTAPCRLGFLLLAATPRGVCHVRFADDEAGLEPDLAAEFPFTALRRDEVGLKPWVDPLLAYVDGHAIEVRLRLDVAGSRFQHRVWKALSAIPRGETRSYAAVARSLGQPRAARAVARACSANPVAVLIPCHRVVASDGGLGGYRWGMERKRALLEVERGGLEDGSFA